MFKVEEMAIELIEALQPVVSRVKARDRALADQLTRASSSAAARGPPAGHLHPDRADAGGMTE